MYTLNKNQLKQISAGNWMSLEEAWLMDYKNREEEEIKILKKLFQILLIDLKNCKIKIT